MAYTQNLNFDYNPPGANTSPFEILGQSMRQQREDEIAARKAQQAEQAQGFINRLNELKGKQMETEIQIAPEMSKAKLATEQAKAKYYGQGGSRGRPTELSKLQAERQAALEKYGEGSKEVQQYDMLLQKKTTNSKMLNQAVLSRNVITSMNKSSPEDLTRYSGVSGAAKLAMQTSKDALTGKASEDYYKYLEAKQAAELEATELRQALGASITPYMEKHLQTLVNPSSASKSPEAAKRQIAKSREILYKQLDNIIKGLEQPVTAIDREATGEKAETEEAAEPKQTKTKAKRFGEKVSETVKGTLNGEEWDIEPGDVEAFRAAGGMVNG